MTELPFVPPRRSVARFLLDYNPFYLLSAMCMLAGLFALNNSLTWNPLPAANLLWLVLVLNIYEMMLIGLGIFLAKRGLKRDASTLLVLEAFFLVDAGFLNSEIFTFNFELGLAINIALLILAGIKLVMVFEGLGLSLADPRLLLAGGQMFVLLAMAGVFKHIAQANNGVLPEMAIYACWWVVGIIPVLFAVLLRNGQERAHRGIIGAFVILPMISIIAHLGTSGWVYGVRWHHSNLSPLLLGLAVLIGVSDYHVRNMTARMRLHLLLPLAAVFLADRERWPLVFMIDGVTLTALRCTLVGAAIVYLHGLFYHRHIYFCVGVAMCLMAAALGGTMSAMSHNASSLSRAIFQALSKIVPRTLTHWGIVSVAASFVLLGLGLVRSLLRIEPARPDDD